MNHAYEIERIGTEYKVKIMTYSDTYCGGVIWSRVDREYTEVESKFFKSYSASLKYLAKFKSNIQGIIEEGEF